MSTFKLFGPFMAVNALVVITISVIHNLFGVIPYYLTSYEIDYQSLAFFCLICGMGSVFISLELSRVMAKWSTDAEVIPPNTNDFLLCELIQTLAGLRLTVEVVDPSMSPSVVSLKVSNRSVRSMKN